MTNIIDSKIILHNYTSYWREPSYIGFFSILPKDGSDIYRFSNRKCVSTMCTVGNLLMSEASLSKLEKFQCSSAVLHIKYNCIVLFWLSQDAPPQPKFFAISCSFWQNRMLARGLGPSPKGNP